MLEKVGILGIEMRFFFKGVFGVRDEVSLREKGKIMSNTERLGYGGFSGIDIVRKVVFYFSVYLVFLGVFYEEWLYFRGIVYMVVLEIFRNLEWSFRRLNFCYSLERITGLVEFRL